MVETANRLGSLPPDFVTLKWSDVPDEFTVYRGVDPKTGKVYTPEAFAIHVVEQDELLHRTFLAMKGK